MDGDSALNFGLMNSLRTGNMIFDMAICLAIPVIMRTIYQILGKCGPVLLAIYDRLLAYFGYGSYYVREIELVERSGRPMLGQEDTRNGVLQKAIAMFIGSKKLSFHNGACQLKAIREKVEENNYGYYGMTFGSTFEQLECYDIVTMPAPNCWSEVAPGVEFQHRTTVDEKRGEEKGPVTTRNTFYLRSNRANGEAMVQEFINVAFKWYKARMKEQEDRGRYMYTLANTKKQMGDDDGGDKYRYKRYRLSDEKKFNCLFIPEKERLVRLVDHFLNRTDKFSIEGFPHKLGLLLHGPPGTGKTSLIKCLAQYTGRHIVNIPLSRIKTNQELMDIVFDLRFKVDEEDLPITLSFEQIIFVMEDIDCASSIVHTRQGKQEKKRVKEGTAGKDPEDIELERAEDDLITRTMTEQAADELDDASSTESEEEGTGKKKKKKKQGPENYDSWETDKLNLSGLLNVLDGVVDTPGRILVMTTNHPEKLDPALIRPGRINKRLFLGYIRRKEASQMIAHYFGETPPEQLMQELPEERFTPAELEQFCAECESIDTLFKLLKDVLDKQPHRN